MSVRATRCSRRLQRHAGGLLRLLLRQNWSVSLQYRLTASCNQQPGGDEQCSVRHQSDVRAARFRCAEVVLVKSTEIAARC